MNGSRFAITMPVIGVSLFIAAPSAIAGAFEIEFGTPIGQLNGIASSNALNGFAYHVQPPQPNAEFSDYVVYATPIHGVCKIVAWGRDHKNDLDGMDIRAAFAEMRQKLANKYSTSQDWDFSHVGNIWTGPSEFAMALNTNSYSLASFWDVEHGANIPADTDIIELEASASSGSTTHLVLDYESKEFEACKREYEAKGDTAL